MTDTTNTATVSAAAELTAPATPTPEASTTPAAPETSTQTLTFDPAKPETFEAIYKALGRPEKADGYEFQLPEGTPGDDLILNGFRDIAHKSGLGTAQAKALYEWYAGEAGRISQEAQEASIKASQEQAAALKKEWGANWDANLASAQQAARYAGLDEGAIDALQKAIGYDKTLKLLSKFGEPLREGSFVGGKSGGGFATPEAARAELQRLNNDSDFVTRLMKGDKSALDQRASLAKIAFDGAA